MGKLKEFPELFFLFSGAAGGNVDGMSEASKESATFDLPRHVLDRIFFDAFPISRILFWLMALDCYPDANLIRLRC